jgi:hypothetical protein
LKDRLVLNGKLVKSNRHFAPPGRTRAFVSHVNGHSKIGFSCQKVSVGRAPTMTGE